MSWPSSVRHLLATCCELWLWLWGVLGALGEPETGDISSAPVSSLASIFAGWGPACSECPGMPERNHISFLSSEHPIFPQGPKMTQSPMNRDISLGNWFPFPASTPHSIAYFPHVKLNMLLSILIFSSSQEPSWQGLVLRALSTRESRGSFMDSLSYSSSWLFSSLACGPLNSPSLPCLQFWTSYLGFRV